VVEKASASVIQLTNEQHLKVGRLIKKAQENMTMTVSKEEDPSLIFEAVR